jgi:hypothetical protein
MRKYVAEVFDTGANNAQKTSYPARLLCCAVIEQALNDLVLCNKNRKRDALEWLTDPRSSLEVYCRMIGLSADKIRQQVERDYPKAS